MFMLKKSLFLFVILFLIISNDFGLTQDFNWSANLRFRSMTEKHPEINWEKEFSSFSETRSRLGLNIIGNYASAKLVLQDSRFLGNIENNPGVTSTTDSPSFHEVYFTFKNLKIPFFNYDFIKIGRFELALGNQRLIAKNNWNNIGRSFEGVLGKDDFLSGSLLLMHLFVNETMNEYHDDRKDVVIDGAYWTKNILSLEETYAYELYFLNFRNMNFGVLGDSLISYNNVGVRLNAQKNNLVLESEITFQTSSGTSSENIASANLLSINLGYKPKKIKYLKSVFLGMDQISGDDTTTKNTKEGFSKEFGARHKHHGYYDYSSHTKYFGHHHEGLKEISLKANINIPKKTNLLIAFHDFKSGFGNIHYGKEIDFIFKTKHNKEITSEFGSIFYFPKEGDKNTLPFFYVMITSNF